MLAPWCDEKLWISFMVIIISVNCDDQIEDVAVQFAQYKIYKMLPSLIFMKIEEQSMDSILLMRDVLRLLSKRYQFIIYFKNSSRENGLLNTKYAACTVKHLPFYLYHLIVLCEMNTSVRPCIHKKITKSEQEEHVHVQMLIASIEMNQSETNCVLTNEKNTTALFV